MEIFSFFILQLLQLAAAVVVGRGVERLFTPYPRLYRRVILYGILYVTITTPSWIGDENPVLLFPFFLLVFLLCLGGGRLQNLVAGGILFTLLVPFSMMLDSAERWAQVLVGEWSISALVKLALWLALAWFLLRHSPPEGVRLSQRLWLLLGGLTLGPMTTVLSFSLWSNHWVDETTYNLYAFLLHRLAYTTLPFVCLSALALFFAVVILSRHESLEREIHLSQLRDVYYKNLQQEQSQVRTLRHDLRNHLTALQGLLEQGETARADSYLAELADSPALGGGKRYCENETANVVLAVKAAAMEADGLIADFAALLPAALPLAAPELCSLLGNALDNAAEAAQRAGDKRVFLRAKAERGLFMLRVENAIGGQINADLSTTKAEKLAHGFGLSGMRDIARRHGGSLDAVARNSRFELVVCLPLVSD